MLEQNNKNNESKPLIIIGLDLVKENVNFEEYTLGYMEFTQTHYYNKTDQLNEINPSIVIGLDLVKEDDEKFKIVSLECGNFIIKTSNANKKRKGNNIS